MTRANEAYSRVVIDAQFADLKPPPEIRYADYVVSGMGSDDTLDGMSKIRRFKQERAIPQDSGFGEHARYRLRLP